MPEEGHAGPAASSGRPATINDVAAAAGVSRQTVTRAVNNMPGINAATRERVLAAARDLHYRPSRFGRGLVKPQARTLGLLIDDLANPYYAELASAVLGLAADAGWNVVLAERAHAAADEFLVEAFADQVDALVSFISTGLPGRSDGLPDQPIVEIDPWNPVTGHGRVDLDMEPAVREAVRHLRDRGVRAPVVLDRVGPSARAKLFLREFGAAGLTPTLIAGAATDLDGGARQAGLVLRHHPEADAVVAFNDVMGFGVLRALALAGIDVPGRIRVVGVDGLRIGRFVTPRLTTLALDLSAVASAALEIVLAMHAGTAPASGPATHRRVAYALDIGESS
ncbi:DNA-binding transcriptional regulator, LacI/PurR family [Nakamurella panacisegetis]|uniref:DNA-binding transcriptional regulator, LacI/PurR family n=1 Tax=Nakamurella panacisegetis TaxID=1090615 RepID=A0A1H0N4N2_9ACTN|nr:LacI family DNA-binding transcriptional regulator [Nakamurella panacisegetis]SDO87657.1 DNA-binding transcriptional regulator, LacI/PurR family [Nakamurella panacisegetis]